jgi:hypothetical protein
MSLREAIERAETLYRKEGRAKIDAKSAVAAWGYSSLNGASLRVLSALRQYGLIEGGNEEIRLSSRGLTLLLEPDTSPEYSTALREALAAPSLYQEILADFPDGLPSDVSMISYLVRKQELGEAAAKSVLESFRESLALVDGYHESYIGKGELANVVSIEPAQHKANTLQATDIQPRKPDWSLGFAWPLSGNTALSLNITGTIPSDDVLAMLSQVLDLAKAQITLAVRDARANKAAQDEAEYLVQ